MSDDRVDPKEHRLSTVMVEVRRLVARTAYRCERLTEPKDLTTADLVAGLDDVMGQRERRIEPPIPMYLTCPKCNARHIDEGDFATKVHHTHSCQSCGLTWRPAVVPTVGVAFLPGFKNEASGQMPGVTYETASAQWRAGYDEAEQVYHAKHADMRRELRLAKSTDSSSLAYIPRGYVETLRAVRDMLAKGYPELARETLETSIKLVEAFPETPAKGGSDGR